MSRVFETRAARQFRKNAEALIKDAGRMQGEDGSGRPPSINEIIQALKEKCAYKVVARWRVEQVLKSMKERTVYFRP